MINVTNLKFSYDSGSPDVINNITFEINEGEIFGFLGPSAAGVESFNQFLARVFMGSMIFSLPVVPMFFFPDTGWLVILPANAAIDLFIRITKGNFSILQLLDILILIIWIFIMRLFAQKQFHKHNLFL